MKMHEKKYGVPSFWYQEDALSFEESERLVADTAQVAQKCTGRYKKPVFLFPDKVVKGPWTLPKDCGRLNRELGRAALMRYWALHPPGVLRPALFERSGGGVYLVTPALFLSPTSQRPWEIESRCRSVSEVGPRNLEVVARRSLGVVRVSDRVKKDPSYLLDTPEVWEHLIHRYLLRCGDSGLHNMLVRPTDDRAIGLDLDENRHTSREDPRNIFSLLFKSPPAKKLRPVLQKSLLAQREAIDAILTRLKCIHDDKKSRQTLEGHGLIAVDVLAPLLATFEAAYALELGSSETR